jgi:putative ATPase
MPAGKPEARLSIAQAIIFICESPKSNSVVVAVDSAFQGAQTLRHDPVPLHLQDTHYKGSDKIKAGEGYLYPHDFPGHYVQQQYKPTAAQNEQYYYPSDQGFEKRIQQLREARLQSSGGKKDA